MRDMRMSSLSARIKLLFPVQLPRVVVALVRGPTLRFSDFLFSLSVHFEHHDENKPGLRTVSIVYTHFFFFLRPDGRWKFPERLQVRILCTRVKVTMAD